MVLSLNITVNSSVFVEHETNEQFDSKDSNTQQISVFIVSSFVIKDIIEDWLTGSLTEADSFSFSFWDDVSWIFDWFLTRPFNVFYLLHECLRLIFISQQPVAVIPNVQEAFCLSSGLLLSNLYIVFLWHLLKGPVFVTISLKWNFDFLLLLSADTFTTLKNRKNILLVNRTCITIQTTADQNLKIIVFRNLLIALQIISIQYPHTLASVENLVNNFSQIIHQPKSQEAM